MDESFKIIGAILLIISSSYACIKAMRKLMAYYSVWRTGQFAKARIVDYKEAGLADNFHYLSVVNFCTKEGKTIVATAKEGNIAKPILNLEIQIVYDPSKPNRFYVHHATNSLYYMLAPFLFLAGSLFGVLLLLLSI